MKSKSIDDLLSELDQSLTSIVSNHPEAGAPNPWGLAWSLGLDLMEQAGSSSLSQHTQVRRAVAVWRTQLGANTDITPLLERILGYYSKGNEFPVELVLRNPAELANDVVTELRNGRTKIIVDCSRSGDVSVQYLIDAIKAADDGGGSVVLCSVPERTEESLQELCRGAIDIYGSLAQARDHFRGKNPNIRLVRGLSSPAKAQVA